MELQSLSMEEQEQFLTEALVKTVSIVDIVDERYRDSAFPIILQSIIKAQGIVSSSSMPVQTQNNKEPQTQERRLPSNISVNEFILKAAPDSHPGYFVCIGYYLLHTGKAAQFSVADILDIYGKLRRTKPVNPSDVINKCIRKAHITDAPGSVNGQRGWVITSEGEKYVEEELLHGNSTRNN